jgi:hypothetical protein
VVQVLTEVHKSALLEAQVVAVVTQALLLVPLLLDKVSEVGMVQDRLVMEHLVEEEEEVHLKLVEMLQRMVILQLVEMEKIK